MHVIRFARQGSLVCEEEVVTIDHLLIHCSRAKMLWNLFLTIMDYKWVFPLTVRQSLLAWQSASVAKSGKEYCWRPLFVYSGCCGMKGTWRLLRMRPPLLSG